MADINMVLKLLKPLDESPDEPVPTMAVLASLACCPGMSPIGGEAEPDPLQKIEAAFMEHALETDANAYKDVHDKIPPAARSTLLLLLYLLYQAKFHESGFELEGDLDERCEIASQVAIRVRIPHSIASCVRMPFALLPMRGMMDQRAGWETEE